MKTNLLIFFSSYFSIIQCIEEFRKKTPIFKCHTDKFNIIPKSAKTILPRQENNNDNMKSFSFQAGYFKDYHIHLDLYNFEDEVKKYKLQAQRELFITGMKRAVNTFQSLLNVKQVKNYVFQDEQLIELGIKSWDKEKIGNETIKNNKGMANLNIDLYIFIKFGNTSEMGEGVLAYAGPYYTDTSSGQPILGIATINRDVDFTKNNSLRYFESVILHEFTHILGFTNYLFENYIHNYKIKYDNDGIKRAYINSATVLNVAKKYFNCPTIDGVGLEEYGGQGTFGSHWEEKILLGDIMCGVMYEEEQAISEFTLALLEDTGYYKVKNYYTGGLMKFGKNKGCDFINKKCVNSMRVNTKFENEFFDIFDMKYDNTDPGCTSGRQSRVYHYLLYYKDGIPKSYQYYNDENIGGKYSADYCPIFMRDMISKNEDTYYTGHCSEIGNNQYGSYVTYKNKSISNGNVTLFTGEEYSQNSFCVLSSLIDKRIKNYENYLGQTRGICYKMFCSDKSLTIKIKNDYIVCPREGGKVKLNNYEGYLLCPDYYLICSGTVICNDMFDCVEKKSSLKEVEYDYEIKTTQNLVSAESEKFSETNYELSENGVCPQYCSHCNQFKKCEECGEGYELSEDGTECKGNYTLYIILGIVGLLIIIIIVAIIVIRCYKKNKALKEDIAHISFKKDTDNTKETLLY